MPELYPEDQKKVDEYLSASIHEVERRPFNPWKLLAVLAVILVGLTVLSFFIANGHGVI